MSVALLLLESVYVFSAVIRKTKCVFKKQKNQNLKIYPEMVSATHIVSKAAYLLLSINSISAGMNYLSRN